MVCKIRPHDEARPKPIPLTTGTARPSAALRRVFAAGALRFEMDQGRSETCAFEDSYARWLERMLKATMMRNDSVEEGVKVLRTKNGELRRRLAAVPCLAERKEDGADGGGDDDSTIDDRHSHGSTSL